MPSSLGGKQNKTGKVNNHSNVTSDLILHEITSLVSKLPPTSASNSNLNPLAELVTVYTTLPLQLDTAASSQIKLQQNRQHVHTAIHSIKSIFEHLIQSGRIHGTPNNNKLSSSNNSTTQSTSNTEAVLRVKEWLNVQYTQFLEKTANVVAQHWDINVRVRGSASRNLLLVARVHLLRDVLLVPPRSQL